MRRSAALKRWREGRGWSQVEAATYFASYGPCSRRTYQRWEATHPPKWVWSVI